MNFIEVKRLGRLRVNFVACITLYSANLNFFCSEISCLFVSEKPLSFLNEEKLVDIIKLCQEEGSYRHLIRALGEVYSNPESLSQSFLRTQPESPIEVMLEKAGEKDLKTLKKEDVRALEGDLDKDEDCHELELEKEKMGENSHSRKMLKRADSVDTSVDVVSLRRAYAHLFKLPTKIFEGMNFLFALNFEIFCENYFLV